MKEHVCPLKCDRFYQVYHCGINGGQLFFLNSNPAKHGITKDLLEYPYSSAKKTGHLNCPKSSEILELFDGPENFEYLLHPYNLNL